MLAVFKELSWAYALGAGDVSREAIREGLGKLLEPETASRFGEEARKKIAAAVPAILAFFEGRWEEAEQRLFPLYGGDPEADGFARWMLLVCAMEKSGGSQGRSAYGAIRARYGSFPEYWFRAARAAQAAGKAKAAGIPGTAKNEQSALAGDYAERCINLAPAGPYAAECRIILAETMGLGGADAPALRTRREIEAAVAASAEQGNPELLAPLLPLAGLPDNPSTLYASGAMRALAANGTFRDWFVREAEKARGRLAERLRYISRG